MRWSFDPERTQDDDLVDRRKSRSNSEDRPTRYSNGEPEGSIYQAVSNGVGKKTTHITILMLLCRVV